MITDKEIDEKAKHIVNFFIRKKMRIHGCLLIAESGAMQLSQYFVASTIDKHFKAKSDRVSFWIAVNGRIGVMAGNHSHQWNNPKK